MLLVDLQIAARNLKAHTRRNLFLGGALAAVTGLLVLLGALTSGMEAAMMQSATTLMTGHVNVGGFFKITSAATAPLVSGYPPLLDGGPGLPFDLGDLLLLEQVHRDADEVADHRLDVPADVADLGELAGLDLEEWRAGQLGQPARDLGLADAGRADHEDVLGGDLVGQVGWQLAPPEAVAQGDGHGLLGRFLADDVFVELGHDLLGRELGLGGFRNGPLERLGEDDGHQSSSTRISVFV